MKDYAKTVSRPPEVSGKNTSRESLKQSAMQQNRAAPSANKKSGTGFFSVIAVFICIAILFAGYRQYTHHKALLNPKAEAASGQVQQQPTNPQFDFYTVLPAGSTPGSPNSNAANSATVPPATPAADAATTATEGATTTVTPSTTTTVVAGPSENQPAPVQTISTGATPTTQSYLNAGQYANLADAQQMLSQLLLLGVQANIQTTQSNGQASYQVLVGPFDDQAAMGIVKQQLAAHQLQTNIMQPQ